MIILFALWFFLPAAFANASPVFAAIIPGLKKLDQPIDFGKTFRGKRLLGKNKTIRGVLIGTIVGALTGLVQFLLYSNLNWFDSIVRGIDYSDPIVIALGGSMGFGALFGDAVESFFKRQLSIQSGKSWFPFDQIDYVIGGIIFSLPFVVLSWREYLAIILVWTLLHPVVTFVGWLLKIRDDPK